ncbi:hypothetical protein Anas_06862 [Armadillidium nasatum]|uniref:Uncharacterized protein n=1 Tax=Armadillidium nasatum TaxID=96803 RepID=A0A5N5SIW7_9CRUS|nr:hypothetical protein Anas_06862 [Armadillidium nasatum]
MSTYEPNFPEEITLTNDKNITDKKETINKDSRADLKPLQSSVDELDYSVKSGEEKLFNSRVVEKPKIADQSKDHTGEVSSSVVPLNMITIQRRSSFMESQLGCTEFVIESPVKNTPTTPTTPITKKSEDQSKSLTKETNLDIQEKNLLSQNKGNTTDTNPPETLKSSPLKSIRKTSNSSESVNSVEKSKEEIVKHYSNFLQTKSQNSTDSAAKDLECISPKLKSIKGSTCSTATVSSSPSNPLSTFGTPVTPTKAPNSSFLHSGMVRPLTEARDINSIIYSTPEFLKDIKKKNNQHQLTAGIQKGALYSPSSSSVTPGAIKGIPIGKPATTPKPNYLKEKPKVPIKPFVSSSNLFSRETTPPKNVTSVLSTTVNDSSVTNFKEEHKTDNNSDSSKEPNDSHSTYSSEEKEIVYDLPVTVENSCSPTTKATFSSPSPSSSSSGYSTTSNLSNIGESNAFQEKMKVSQIEPSDDSSEKCEEQKLEEVRILSKSPSTNDSPSSETSNNYEEQISQTQKSDTEKQEVQENYVNEIKAEEEKNAKNSDERLNAPSYYPYNENIQNYVNIPSSPYESHDIDSYSSFTDDFDDDDDDEEEETTTSGNQGDSHVILGCGQNMRRTERSSSATPLFRNSIGPVNFYQTNNGISLASAEYDSSSSKPQAVRSQSVPRSSGIIVDPAVFNKPRNETSRFAFVKSGLFRPSSPPSSKRKESSERGRDRTKKSHSVFSLKKFLRFGSGEKSLKTKDLSAKEQDKSLQRETRKMKLQIIHPLDYNTNGVEVIARPEKRSPTYDFTGINDPLIQETLKQHALEMKNKAAQKDESSNSGLSIPNAVKNTFSKAANLSERKVVKKNSFLRKRRKSEKIESSKNEIYTATSTYVRPGSISSDSNDLPNNAVNNNNNNNINNSNNNINNNPRSINISSSNNGVGNLGFNSEGRPRPPPPPRKTSLDSGSDLMKSSFSHQRLNYETNFPIPLSSSGGSKADCDTSSISSTCSSTRPSRPPPPRRAPGSVGASRLKDSVYANLGNARASFTPRKPGRTSSVRDEEREKRKAPNPPLPPPPPQQVGNFNPIAPNFGSSSSSFDHSRQNKGPAPPAPVGSPSTHDYEYISNSPEKFSGKKECTESRFATDPLISTFVSRNRDCGFDTPEGYIIPAYIQFSTYFQSNYVTPC